MPSRRERLLSSHLSALETTETRAARQIAAAYNQARTELIATLLGAWNPAGVDTPEQALARLRQLALLEQIDARLAQLERENGVALRGILNVASEQGVEQVKRELALLPPSLRPPDVLAFATINERMVERFAPVALDGLRVSTMDLGLTLRRELQSGLIQGEAFPSLVSRLLRGVPEGEGVAVFPRARTSAVLATRRAVITAENASKVEAIGEVAKAEPLIQKQAIAVVGKGTTDCCLRVHGQIQNHDAPFQLTGEPRFADAMMAPAFHWNCRTGTAMYHPAFESSTPTATMRADAKAERDRRREEKAAKSRSADERAAARVARVEREAAERAAREAERGALFDVVDEEAEAIAEQPVTGLQYQPTADTLAKVRSYVDEEILGLATTHSLDEVELEQTIRESFNKLVAEHDIAVQFKSQHIDALLTDGRFKTQFEIGESGGLFNPTYRANAEDRGLGIPKGVDPKERPIYGFLNLGPGSQGMVAQYGDITFIAKDAVRQRSTVTAGDSLYNFGTAKATGSPVTAPDKEAWDTKVDALYDYATGYHDANGLVGQMGYVEVQVQRGLSLGDMRAVIDTRGRLTAMQRQALQEMGVEVWEK